MAIRHRRNVLLLLGRIQGASWSTDMRCTPLVVQTSTQAEGCAAARVLEMVGAKAPKTTAHSASHASRLCSQPPVRIAQPSVPFKAAMVRSLRDSSFCTLLPRRIN